MIQVKLKNNILSEERSKSKFLDKASRDIKNFIIDQFNKFPETYFKQGVYEFKINDLESINKNEEINDIKDLKIIVQKKQLGKDLIKIERAFYDQYRSYIKIKFIFDTKLNSFEQLDKKYLQSLHEDILNAVYHELIHHTQFKYFRIGGNKNNLSYASLSFPLEIYPVNSLSGASDQEIEEYKYLSSPEEIDAYTRDTMLIAKKQKIPFSKALKRRLKFYEKIFISSKGKYLFNAILYNSFKYAIQRYPNINTEENKSILGRFKTYLDKNKQEDKMKKEVTAESLTINFRNWIETEVLSESSVSQLMSSHDIPKSFAKHVKQKCSNGNADFILKVFLKNYKNMVENMTSESAVEKDQMLNDNYIMEFDRFMGHAGKTLDEYLKKHKGKKYRQEILELCEAGWPKFLKKMTEYKKSIEESINEVRLNKTWKKRIKQRAKRHERDVSEEDKKWAKSRLKDLNKKYPELEEAYLNEIEAAMEAAKASNVYLEKLRTLRKQKLESENQLVKPTADNLKKRKDPPKRPTADKRKPNEKIKGPFAATGEIIGGMALEQLDVKEENNDE